MDIAIDPTFSVYYLVERIKQQSTLLNHRHTMSLISYEIENAIIKDQARGRVFSGFQYLSRFLPQHERYRQLAAYAEAVYVFGVPDVVPPPVEGVIYVPLQETDQLAKEWFLVMHGADYHSILATEELSDIHDPDVERLFQGVWSFDLDMVAIVEEWLSSAVDAHPLHFNAYDEARKFDLMQRSLERLVKFTNRRPKTETQEIVRSEVRTLIKEKMHPALLAISTSYVAEDHEREVVIMFTDLRDFTQLSEQMAPQDLVTQVINPYLRLVSSAVVRFGGSVDKFLGDGVLAVFGLDDSLLNPTDQALAAARAIISAPRRPDSKLPPIGVGLAQGPVLVGRIGSSTHYEQTVIGDAVNVASRLSDRAYNDIWLTGDVYDNLSNHDGIQSCDDIQIRGKAAPQRVYCTS